MHRIISGGIMSRQKVLKVLKAEKAEVVDVRECALCRRL